MTSRVLASVCSLLVGVGPLSSARALANDDDLPDGDADIADTAPVTPPVEEEEPPADEKPNPPPPAPARKKKPIVPEEDALSTDESTSEDTSASDAENEAPVRPKHRLAPASLDEPSSEEPPEAEESHMGWVITGATVGALAVVAGAGIGGYFLVGALTPKTGSITVTPR